MRACRDRGNIRKVRMAATRGSLCVPRGARDASLAFFIVAWLATQLLQLPSALVRAYTVQSFVGALAEDVGNPRQRLPEGTGRVGCGMGRGRGRGHRRGTRCTEGGGARTIESTEPSDGSPRRARPSPSAVICSGDARRLS